jgi:hypothetical protein
MPSRSQLQPKSLVAASGFFSLKQSLEDEHPPCEKCHGRAELSTSVDYAAIKKCPSLYTQDLSTKLNSGMYILGTWSK